MYFCEGFGLYMNCDCSFWYFAFFFIIIIIIFFLDFLMGFKYVYTFLYILCGNDGIEIESHIIPIVEALKLTSRLQVCGRDTHAAPKG